MSKKYCFIDRDGTLIVEPDDQQIDTLEKLDFMPGVFSALKLLQQAGFYLVMVSNQDGLGTPAFPYNQFSESQQMMLRVFKSQGILFEEILICPHRAEENCGCRKPEVGLLMNYLIDQSIDMTQSIVIGDRASDLDLAKRLGITGYQIGTKTVPNWETLVEVILNTARYASLNRTTNETKVLIQVNLDASGASIINTGIGFFDHMLEQIVKQANIQANIQVIGDLNVDAHHTIEDTAITFGMVLKKALGDKFGIERYGYSLPMDEAAATVLLDLSGRCYCSFKGDFSVPMLGEMPTEMIGHFYESFARGLCATIQVELKGKNNHHICEAGFKALGRALGKAIIRSSSSIPSTKGVLT